MVVVAWNWSNEKSGTVMGEMQVRAFDELFVADFLPAGWRPPPRRWGDAVAGRWRRLDEELKRLAWRRRPSKVTPARCRSAKGEEGGGQSLI
jgi:hypothetical protein